VQGLHVHASALWGCSEVGCVETVQDSLEGKRSESWSTCLNFANLECASTVGCFNNI